MLHAAYNGMSEFTNQLSAAIVILVFNWVMIRRFGVEGVAAFTIMHYIFFAEQIIVYGFSDALQPIISTNFGARRPDRISGFLVLGISCAVTVGVVLVVLLLAIPEKLASLFLDNGTDATYRLTLAFISFSWPAFLWNGSNVVFSSYFTAIHKPLPSAVIALSRTLFFPLIFITVLPIFFGDAGIFVSFSIAEFLTFLIVLLFFSVMRPQKSFSRHRRESGVREILQNHFRYDFSAQKHQRDATAGMGRTAGKIEAGVLAMLKRRPEKSCLHGMTCPAVE